MARQKKEQSIFDQLEKGTTIEWGNYSQNQIVEAINDLYSKYCDLRGEKISSAKIASALRDIDKAKEKLEQLTK